MEIARLIIDAAEVLLWPVVVFGIFLLLVLRFSSQLEGLIGRVASIETPVAKVTLSPEDRAQPVQSHAEPVADRGLEHDSEVPTRLDGGSTMGDDERAATIADNPQAAIVETWAITVKEIYEIARTVAPYLAADSSIGATLFELRVLGLVEDSELDTMQELATVRNQLVHGQPVSADASTASEYAARATRVTGAIRDRVGKR